jgi:hypothetical protein
MQSPSKGLLHPLGRHTQQLTARLTIQAVFIVHNVTRNLAVLRTLQRHIKPAAQWETTPVAQ